MTNNGVKEQKYIIKCGVYFVARLGLTTKEQHARRFNSAELQTKKALLIEDNRQFEVIKLEE